LVGGVILEWMEEFFYILMERLLASERITRGKERVARIKKI
jgi:hypothetical protein